jgi:hypothetical protein
MVDLATGNAQETDPYKGKDASAVNLGRRDGLKGGKARAAKMTAERRAEITRKAAKAMRFQKNRKSRTRDGATFHVLQFRSHP